MVGKRTALLLVLALLIIGVLLRYPTSSFVAEHGADASYYGALSQMTVTEGRMPWATHLSAYFGLYPFSEGSVTPIMVAVGMELTGLGIDLALIATSMGLALLGALGVYLCIHRATRSVPASLIGAFAYLTAPILLYYSDQTLTSRFVAVTWSPFLILVVVERRRWGTWKSLIIAGLLVFLLVGSHLSFALIVLVMVGILVLTRIDEQWRKMRAAATRSRVARTVSRHYSLGWIALGALGVLATGFLAQLAGLESLGTQAYEIGIFSNSTVFGYYGNMIASTAGGAGLAALLLTPLAPRLAGLTHRDHTLPIVAGAILVTALVGFRLYIRPFIAAVFSLSAGLGYVAVARLAPLNRGKALRYATAVAIASFLVVSAGFSLYVESRWNRVEYYSMSGQSYSAFTYIKDSTRGNLYCNHYVSDRFLTAYTSRFCLPDLPGSGLEMTPFVSGALPWSDLIVVPKNLAELLQQQSTIELYDVFGYNPYPIYYSFSQQNLTSDASRMSTYGIHYALEYRPDTGTYEVRWNVGSPAASGFLEAVHQSSYLAYQNEEYSLWTT